MEIRTWDLFYYLILIDDGNFLGHWLVVLCSWLHRCLHKFWMFWRSVLTRRAIIPAAQTLPFGFSFYLCVFFYRWLRIRIDCVNGQVRAVWKVAFCIYLFIPGISNPFTDKNYLYPPFHGFSRLEQYVCLGNTKYKQNLTLLSKLSKDMALQIPFLASGL